MPENSSPLFRSLPVVLLFAVSHVFAQPKITSFSPASGPVNTSLTINGSGFNTGPAGNTIIFGPVTTTATTASSTSLTVIVPAGTASQNIAVLNNATALTGYSSTQYTTNNSSPVGSNITPSFLQPRIDFTTSYMRPNDPVFSDLDGDGKPDMIFVDVPSSIRETGTVAIWRNVSTSGALNSSSFAPAITLQPGQYPGTVNPGDLDGDGKPDMIIQLGLSNRISIHRNSSSGSGISFSGGGQISLASDGFRLVFSDVDVDGKPDIVIGYSSGTIAVLRNLSVPGRLDQTTFAPAVNFSTGYNLTSIRLTDLDGDGKPELLANGYGSNTSAGYISLLQNTSTPGIINAASFAPKVDLPLSGANTIGRVLTGDADGDGKPDILISLTNQPVDSGKIAVLRNTSIQGTLNASSFAPEVDFPAGFRPDAVRLADVDGDGKVDILFSNPANGINTSAISILLSNATAGSITTSSFAGKITIPADNTDGADLLDLDTDGRPEIVTNATYPFNFSTFRSTFLSVFKIRTTPYPFSVFSVTPSSAPAGATVTIAGAQFNTNAASNTVFFGAVKGTVTGGSSTRLSVVVPPGATYQQVSVLNTGTGLTAYSPQPFLPAFTNPSGPGIAAGFYQQKFDYPTGSPAGTYPYSFAIGDVDGDGKSDMAVVHANSGIVTVLRNTSPNGNLNASSFTQQSSFATGPNPLGVQIRDMDGDGKPDLVVVKALPDTVRASGTLSVLRNTSVAGTINDGSFAARVDYNIASNASPFSLAIGDMNSDGKPDIVTANTFSKTVSVFRNTSSPGNITAASFSIEQDIPAPSPRAVAIGDLNGDGMPEIVVSNDKSNLVSVFPNNASNLFNQSFIYQVGSSPSSIVISDVDGDGKPDLIAGNYNSNSISVLRNTSTGSFAFGTFSFAVDFATGSLPFAIAAGDADGDGKPDVIVANAGSNTLSILRNTSTAGTINTNTFAPKVDFATGVYPISVAIADLDSDGIAEAAALNASTFNLSVFKINPPVAQKLPPRVVSFSPAKAPAGASVTITGENFNSEPGGNTVYFGGAKAVVTAASSTSLSVTVPAGATNRLVTVLNNANGLAGYSSTPFYVTFSHPFGQSIPAGFYLPKFDLATGKSPSTVTTGDLDGDGRPDLVVVNVSPGEIATVSVFRNISGSELLTAGSFSPKADFTAGGYSNDVTIADLDGDGRLDLVAKNFFSFSISVLRNTSAPGSISFASKVDYATNQFPGALSVNDIDKDGKPEIVVGYTVPPYNCSIYRNTSVLGGFNAGSFERNDIGLPSGIQYRTVSDIDGDAKPDLLLSDPATQTLLVSRNISAPGVITTASFAPRTYFGRFTTVRGDVDGDGRLDLLFPDSVQINTSTPGNIRTTVYPWINEQNTFNSGLDILEDVDGDGLPELINTGGLSIQRNLSAGGIFRFSAATRFPTNNSPTNLTVGDLNADGISELIASSSSSNTLSIFQIDVYSPSPIVTAITPDSNRVGTSVNISGSNFNDIPSNNIVYFGAVKAQVTAGSTTELTATVPAGATYQPISVLNSSNGLTGYANKPFTPTFESPFGNQLPADFYRPKLDFATGALPYSVAIGDMDGDGKPELVTANFNASTISVLHNTSATGTIDASSFGSRTDFATGANPYSAVLIDVDGDGKLDIVTVNYGSSTVSVFRNTSTTGSIGSTSFAAKVDFVVGNATYPIAIAAGDLDRDGKPELVVANTLGNTVSVLRNTSAKGAIDAASFAPKFDYTQGPFPRAVAIGDVDGDFRPDLIVLYQQTNTVTIFRNTGTSGSIDAGSFLFGVSFHAGPDPFSVALGDLNRDGKPELVIANHTGPVPGTLSVLRNTSTQGNILFDDRQSLLSNGNAPFSVAIGDVNGDGEPDIVAANSVSNTVSVLRHIPGAGGAVIPALFDAAVTFPAGGYPLWVAVGDLDGDGIAELVSANAASSVSLFKIGQPSFAAISSLTGKGVTTEVMGRSGSTIKLYPNPSTGTFTLQLSGLKAPVAAVEILNEAGRTVLRRSLNLADKATSTTLRLSLAGQPAGVYYVKVTGVDGVQVMKLVLQQ